MNKEKGEEIRGFLRWLEREIGVEIDTLKNKTKIQGYFDLSFEELLEFSGATAGQLPSIHQAEISKNRWSASLQIASPNSTPYSPAFRIPMH